MPKIGINQADFITFSSGCKLARNLRHPLLPPAAKELSFRRQLVWFI
jgi:hypothetical protein